MGQEFQEELQTRIRGIILRRLYGTTSPRQEITADTPILGKGLGLDSVEALALVTEIESEFDIGIDDEELTVDLFRNIGTLAEFVGKKLSWEQRQVKEAR
jgi:acyl carrier protein